MEFSRLIDLALEVVLSGQQVSTRPRVVDRRLSDVEPPLLWSTHVLVWFRPVATLVRDVRE